MADWIGGMNERTNEGMKHRVWRRIAVKSVIFAVWAIGMLALGSGIALPKSVKRLD